MNFSLIDDKVLFMLFAVNLSNLFLIFIFFGVIILLWNVFLTWRFLKINKRLKIFFKNHNNAGDFEGVISEQIKRTRKIQDELKEIKRQNNYLYEIGLKSIQKIGLKRFNPFNEVGSNQSFVIALLDNKNDGLIISSLFLREGMRIYAKPLKNGKSKYSLSEEEKETIKEAIAQNPN